MTRNQAHGSPANLLDLYAASDIPETEGTEISRSKWASSAGHVAGRRLIAAEAATWLGEHFRSTLADIRANVDRYFVSGVNHIVYHGTAASPSSAPWPGWQFYAAVEFNDRNPWWRDLPALNQYVTRVQSFLQSGAPDHDVLLYYPFYDFAAAPGSGRLAHFGGANAPAQGSAFEAARDLMQRGGFTYDFVSDRQLRDVRLEGTTLVTGGGTRYSAIVLPASRYIPLETFTHVVALANQGARVIAFGGLAADVSGLADLSNRRDQFRRADTSRILRGDDLEALLAGAGVCTRTAGRSWTGVREAPIGAGPVLLHQQQRHVRLHRMGPARHRGRPRGRARSDARASAVPRDRVRQRGGLEVHLDLPAGESIIVSAGTTEVREAAPPAMVAGPSIAVDGPWRLQFVAGGPTLPAAQTIDRLSSWTTFGGDDLKAFSGTALYSTRFPRPRERAESWRLDLGRVHDSAQVRLNGRDLGTLIGPQFGLTVTPDQFRASNLLEVSVTNLMANRIAALDRSGVPWKRFYNVNFPSRLPENRGPDGLFTAAKWEPLVSGLLGPVMLTPLRQ